MTTTDMTEATEVAERCGQCGAPAAHDQRYCVNCGFHRRNAPDPVARYLSEASAARGQVAAARVAAAARRRRLPRLGREVVALLVALGATRRGPDRQCNRGQLGVCRLWWSRQEHADPQAQEEGADGQERDGFELPEAGAEPAELGDAMTSGRIPDAELAAERDRLTERFALMQSELGGLFYEMAIRDHLQLELLVERAAALQRVDTELRELERGWRDRRRPNRSPTAGVKCGVAVLHMNLARVDQRARGIQNPIILVSIVELLELLVFERGLGPRMKGI